MKQELEIVKYPKIKYINLFLNEIVYRSPHLHSDIEIVLVLDGELTLYTKNAKQIYQKNSIFIVNSNELHEYVALQSPVKLLLLQISPTLFEETYPELIYTIFICTDLKNELGNNDINQVRRLLIRLAEEYILKDNGYQLKCCEYIYQLFYILTNTLSNKLQTQEQLNCDFTKAARLKRVINFITQNYTQNILLSDLAAIEHLSVSYLSHFIKDNMGISFQVYVNKLRINYAIELIHSSDLRLIDISEQCGYSDYRYFHKAFVNEFKCTPNEYRKKKNSLPVTRELKYGRTAEKYYTDSESIHYLHSI